MGQVKVKRIPIARAKEIAKAYGYDEVIIIARKHEPPESERISTDWVTTYGINREHCKIAGLLGKSVQESMYVFPLWVDTVKKAVEDLKGHRGVKEIRKNLEELIKGRLRK